MGGSPLLLDSPMNRNPGPGFFKSWRDFVEIAVYRQDFNQSIT
jgi:hypothetical protein